MFPVEIPSIRAAVVDDEPRARTRIRDFLEPERDIELIAEYTDASSACAGLDAVRPNLLFLEAQMARRSAFSILQSLPRETQPATIFVTAHDEYAVEAFDCNAVVDFLLKPVDAERFRRSLDRARRHLYRADGAAPREHLSRLAVTTRGKVHLLHIDEVDWVETAGNYVRLHTGPAAHLYRDSLMNFETKLDPRRFIRIHRSTVVNIDRVATLEPSFRREHIVCLRDGTRLTLSAPYRSRLQAIVGAF
jgi:two-component system LytT family response regulator